MMCSWPGGWRKQMNLTQTRVHVMNPAAAAATNSSCSHHSPSTHCLITRCAMSSSDSAPARAANSPAAAPADAASMPPNPLLDMTVLSQSSSLSSLQPCWPWTPSHLAFRVAARSFVTAHLTPDVVDAAEESGRAPASLLKASYAAGLYSLRAPQELGGTPPPGALLNSQGQFDLLYDVVLVQELTRCGALGLATELMGSFGMVLPLLQAFARSEEHKAILAPMVRAEIMVCFAVSEPPPPKAAAVTEASAGSKPSRPPAAARGPPGLRTTATLSADGSEWEINGEKMFISFGLRADYILTAVQLRRPSSNAGEDSAVAPPALSLILVPARTPGVHVRNMPLAGWCSTSTTRISFDRVRLPASSLLVDGGGDAGAEVPRTLATLMRSNVTRERFVTGVMAAAAARLCLNDAVAFARSKVVGPGSRTLLRSSAAISEQLVTMGARVTQAEALVLRVALQLSAPEQAAGESADSDRAAAERRERSLQCAMLKYACSDALNFCVAGASAVLGAAALARGGHGPGARVERLRRDAPINAAAGGGEHTLLAFIAKQAKL